jgi:hypothetical protein
VPDGIERQGGLGHKVQLTAVELERRLLQVEGLVARAQMAGGHVEGLAEGLEATWETLLLCQSHDCAVCPCHWQGKYSRDRLSLFPKEDHHDINAIPEHGLPMIGQRAMMLLGPALERVAAIETRALESLGLKRSHDATTLVRYNPQSFTVEGRAPGLGTAGPGQAESPSWKFFLEAGELVIQGPAGLRLRGSLET